MAVDSQDIGSHRMIPAEVVYGVHILAVVVHDASVESVLPEICSPNNVGRRHIRQLTGFDHHAGKRRLPIKVKSFTYCPDNTIAYTLGAGVWIKLFPSAHLVTSVLNLHHKICNILLIIRMAYHPYNAILYIYEPKQSMMDILSQPLLHMLHLILSFHHVTT